MSWARSHHHSRPVGSGLIDSRMDFQPAMPLADPPLLPSPPQPRVQSAPAVVSLVPQPTLVSVSFAVSIGARAVLGQGVASPLQVRSVEVTDHRQPQVQKFGQGSRRCVEVQVELDVIGRRPIVLIGIFGIGLATVFMGLSSTLGGVLFARSLGKSFRRLPQCRPLDSCDHLGGLFSGNIAVIHSVLGEITDSTNQAIAFPLYGLCWPLGAIIG